jgi:hypothetical protein
VNMQQDSHTIQNAVWWPLYRNEDAMMFVDMLEELQKDTISVLFSLWAPSVCAHRTIPPPVDEYS